MYFIWALSVVSCSELRYRLGTHDPEGRYRVTFVVGKTRADGRKDGVSISGPPGCSSCVSSLDLVRVEGRRQATEASWVLSSDVTRVPRPHRFLRRGA